MNVIIYDQAFENRFYLHIEFCDSFAFDSSSNVVIVDKYTA